MSEQAKIGKCPWCGYKVEFIDRVNRRTGVSTEYWMVIPGGNRTILQHSQMWT